MNRIKIAMLGAGNMGTAMSHVLAGLGHPVALWDFFPETVKAILYHRENRRFLPGIPLHEGIRATSDLRDCVAGAALVVIGVPSVFAGSTLDSALPALDKEAVLLNLAKGFAPGTLQPLPLTLADRAHGHACVHLAGPAIAHELARGLTASVVLAARQNEIAQRVAGWMAGPSFITATTSDVLGAALGGILKNVYAILLGVFERLGPMGQNLQAAVLSASVQEMALLAKTSGGRTETLFGLAGLGDLVATGFSPDSHNRNFGQSLAAGKTTAEFEAETGWLPEGARAAKEACALADEGRVAAPLAGLVLRWIGGARPSLEELVCALRTGPPS
jgi:glycerol-3-phosphate dehydrogenase (NAD(P)+)